MTAKFSISKTNDLIKNGQRKDLLDAKEYLLQYFYPLNNGMILFCERGKKTMLSQESFRTTYGNRIGVLAKFFQKDTDTIYDIIVDTHKPFLDGDDLNMFQGFKHSAGEPNEDAKAGVDMMLQFIKSVWASDNEIAFNYLISWIANLCQGNKNNTILYLKSFVEGIGKSTVTSFLMKHVLGNAICIESNSDPLKSAYNEILCGKLLVVFEELESSNTGDWNVISTKLKRWSTSNEIVYTDKYIKSYTSNNINNYIICTNQDAVKSSEGRRYFICDLSTKYKGNDKYFNDLYDTCFTDEVGKAFFQYMLKVDVKKFNPQKMPETKAKNISHSDRLHSLFKFIKFNYILENKDLKISTKELFKDYSDYLIMSGATVSMTKNKMISLLREHSIDYKSSNSKAMYNISNATLRTIGEKFKWFFSDDAEESDENLINKDESDYMKVKKSDYENMQEQIAELTRQLNEMKDDKPKKAEPKSKVKTVSKMSLEAVSDKSLFDNLPTKATAKKTKIFKNILDDIE